MKLNRYFFEAAMLLSLSLSFYSNPIKAEPKWWDEWVVALKKAQPKENTRPKKGYEKTEPTSDPIATAADRAVAMLSEDKFRIWDICSAGTSCQADAVFIRDLKHAILGKEKEALIAFILRGINSDVRQLVVDKLVNLTPFLERKILIAILLTHRDPAKVGQRFEYADLINNLISFGLLPQSAMGISKNQGETLLRATREAYMQMMVSHFGYENPREIIERNKEGSRFFIKDEHKVEFYKKVFKKFRNGPIVLALYEGFPAWEKSPIFTGVKYLFTFDFDQNKGEKGEWVLRTKRKDLNECRYGHGPYLTQHSKNPPTFCITMNPHSPWLSPGFVDEGIGPEEGENCLVTHVGGFWHPGSHDPLISLVEEIKLTNLDLENFLIESLSGFEVGPASEMVQFSILHHNFIENYSKRFFERLPSFSEQPGLMDMPDPDGILGSDGGISITFKGKDAYPFHIRSRTPQEIDFFKLKGEPDFTLSVMIKKKAYILKLPTTKAGSSYFHDLANAEFTVIESEHPEVTAQGASQDWDLFVGSMRPFVTTDMAPRAAEEFGKIHINKENFGWWHKEFGKFLTDGRLAYLPMPEFSGVPVKFGKPASRGKIKLSFPEKQAKIRTLEDAIFVKESQRLKKIKRIQLSDGRIVDATFLAQNPDEDSLLNAVRVSRSDFIAAVVSVWTSAVLDPEVEEWIEAVLAEENAKYIFEWEEIFAQSQNRGSLNHMRLLSRLFGISIHIYVLSENGLQFEPAAENSQGVIDESQLKNPEPVHVLCRLIRVNGAKDFVNHADRIDIHELGRDRMVEMQFCFHPPDSDYTGPSIVGDVMHLWYKPWRPGQLKLITNNKPYPKPEWDPPRRESGELTPFEQQCIAGFLEAVNEGFEPDWECLWHMPPIVTRRLTELGCIQIGYGDEISTKTPRLVPSGLTPERITLMPEGGDSYHVSQQDYDRLSQLAPTIGEYISEITEIGDPLLNTIPLPASSLAIDLLLRHLQGSETGELAVQILQSANAEAALARLENDAQFLQSDFLRQIIAFAKREQERAFAYYSELLGNIKRLQTPSGKIVDVTYLPQPLDANCLFDALGIPRADFIAVTVNTFHTADIEAEVTQWIQEVLADEGATSIEEWARLFAGSQRRGGKAHMRLISRLFGLRIQFYHVFENQTQFQPPATESRGVIDESQKAKPEVVHISWNKVRLLNAEKAVDHMNRLVVQENAQTTPQVLEDCTLDSDTLSPLAPNNGEFFSDLADDDQQPNPQDTSQELTALERDCLEEVERHLARRGIDLLWIATLPPMVIQILFNRGVLSGESYDNHY